eukprot:COSAG02_NODE_1549_length_11966_cov_3.777282_4_plen_162_part_00
MNGNIANSTITSQKLADATIQGGKIADLTIGGNHIGAGEITESKIGLAAVTESRLATDAVTVHKIADGAVTSDKLSDDVSFDTDGTITLKNSAGNAVLKMNQAVSGVSSAGFGTIQGGPLEQYGFLIDENPQSGTYQKSLAYANQFRVPTAPRLKAIAPAS